MRKRSQRLWLIGAAAVLLTGAVALGATALKGSVAFFYDPTALIEQDAAKPGVNARVGGLVQAGSVKYPSDGKMEFDITDGKNSRHVVFSGLKPDMFGDGQGIVAVGKFDHQGNLVADKLLAKHDESYLPKELEESLRKRAGEAGAAAYRPRPQGAGS